MKRTGIMVAGVVILAGVLFAGYWIGRMQNRASSVAGRSSAAEQRKILYWYDPMAPQQHFDHPGRSPMGMRMVPKYANTTRQTEPGVVRIAPEVIENLGVRTTLVRVAPLNETVRVPATVTWDTRESVTVSARVNETIDRLYVRAPFATVCKGEPLAKVLAPEWSAAGAEYLALRHAESKSARSLRGAALQRLHALGMDDATIAGLRAGNPEIVLRAPITGVITQLAVTQGEQVSAGAPLMTLNALNHVWVEADIPQAQIAGIAAGTSASVTVSAQPGETFHGEVQRVLPEVNPATRTERVRIVLGNPQQELVPGMFVEVAIHAAAGAVHPLVPDGALVTTGNATRVILAEGGGTFRVVPVRIGRAANGETAILAGLSGGERVVTSGQFLIDSEASLSGALERLSTPARPGRTASKPPAAKPAMPGMTMPQPGTRSIPSASTNPSMPGMARPPSASTQVPASASPASDRPELLMPAPSSGARP